MKGCELWCHYSESLDSLIKSYVDKYYLKKIIAIPENAGLCVTENIIEVIGPANVKIFEGDNIKEFKPCNLLK